jgi:hypothetical protein
MARGLENPIRVFYWLAIGQTRHTNAQSRILLIRNIIYSLNQLTAFNGHCQRYFNIERESLYYEAADAYIKEVSAHGECHATHWIACIRMKNGKPGLACHINYSPKAISGRNFDGYLIHASAEDLPSAWV